MNVRKRSGVMSQKDVDPVKNNVAPRARFAKGNRAQAIDNSVAVKPNNNPPPVTGAVSQIGKFSY